MGLDVRLVMSEISVMTEITGKKKLPVVVERFILHWGDMGDEWGVNRSVSQIHGLLYLAERVGDDGRGHRRHARHGAVERLQFAEGIDVLGFDPPRTDPR